MAVTAGVVAVTGLAVSFEEQSRARRNQKRIRDTQRRQAAIANSRARRKARADARRLQARTTADAAARGVIGSSATAGSLSSISSQAAEVIGFSRTSVQAGEQIAGFSAAAARATGRAATASAIGSLPGQLGIQPSFASVFSGGAGDAE
jgi:hypothetical protein